MNDHAAIRTELEERLRELTARASQIDDDLSKPGDDDWEENAIESEGDEVLASVGRTTLDSIRQIKLALSAISTGSYGRCSACKQEIGVDRLEALSEATKCAACA